MSFQDTEFVCSESYGEHQFLGTKNPLKLPEKLPPLPAYSSPMPAWSRRLSETPNPNPLPAYSNQMPAWSRRLSETPNPNPLPVYSNQMPAWSRRLSETPNPLPESVPPLPAYSNQMPARPRRMSQNLLLVPEIKPPLPAYSPPPLPAYSSQMPASPRRMSECLLQLPEIKAPLPAYSGRMSENSLGLPENLPQVPEYSPKRRDSHPQKQSDYPIEQQDRDAESLFEALNVLGIDEVAVIRIICGLENKQRQQIEARFKRRFRRDLIGDLKSKLSGHFRQFILACMMPSEELDADTFHKAIFKNNDCALVAEMMCSRTIEEVSAAKKAYSMMFERDLEVDIRNSLVSCGYYRRLMNYMMQTTRRDFSTTPKVDAIDIYDALQGEGNAGEELKILESIFGLSSLPHLQAMLHHFHKLFEKDIEGAVKGWFSANFEMAIKVIANCARNMQDYFASEIHKSVVEKDHDRLIQLVVSRSERDLLLVKQCFQHRYHRTLVDWIEEKLDKAYYSGAILTLLLSRISTQLIPLSQYEVPLLKGTIKPSTEFDKDKDTKELYYWGNSFNVPNREATKIICRRTNWQRQQIKANFMKNGSIIDYVECRLKDNTKKVVLACMMPSEELDAVTLRKAIKGFGTENDWALIVEFMCCRTSEEISIVDNAYKKMFKRSLGKDLRDATRGDVSGDFGRLMKYMQKTPRDDFTKPSSWSDVTEDVEVIYQACAGEGTKKTIEEFVKLIFVTRSLPHLHKVIIHFHTTFQKDIESAIEEGNFSDKFKKAIKVIANCARNMQDYFATRIYRSMCEEDHNTLVYLVVSRSERDLLLVNECFQQRYHKKMEEFIQEKLSGLYRETLLILVRGW